MKIKQGDTVAILSGKDKGKTGIVTKTLQKKQAVLVDGLNVITKHQKPTRRGSQGQLVTKSAPLPVGKVGLVVDGKPVRVGYTIEQKNEKRIKTRIVHKTGKKI